MMEPEKAGYDQSNPSAGAVQPGYGQPQTTVVVTQPVSTTAAVVTTSHTNYLIPSIFACLCCFWPTGLCAIYFSLRANTLMGEGDLSGAQSAANTAKILMFTTIAIGVVWLLIVIILAASGSLATHAAATSYTY